MAFQSFLFIDNFDYFCNTVFLSLNLPSTAFFSPISNFSEVTFFHCACLIFIARYSFSFVLRLIWPRVEFIMWKKKNKRKNVVTIGKLIKFFLVFFISSLSTLYGLLSNYIQKLKSERLFLLLAILFRFYFVYCNYIDRGERREPELKINILVREGSVNLYKKATEKHSYCDNIFSFILELFLKLRFVANNILSWSKMVHKVDFMILQTQVG